MSALMSKTVDGQSLSELVALMRQLLGPNGCPWDREQTLESLRPYVIEEAYEVVDAIDQGKPEPLREELGDLLLQIVFQAELARAQDWFGIDDVVSAISDKLVTRHPWVFGDESVDGASEAVDSWEAIKAKEKAGKKDKGALSGVPVALPSLLRATRVGEKAAAVGYDWPDAGGPRSKIDEELSELDAATTVEAKEAELGDLLFAIVTWARHNSLDPEAALRGTLNRFSERFRHCELAAAQDGKTLRDYDEAALDGMWERAKVAVG